MRWDGRRVGRGADPDAGIPRASWSATATRIELPNTPTGLPDRFGITAWTNRCSRIVDGDLDLLLCFEGRSASADLNEVILALRAKEPADEEVEIFLRGLRAGSVGEREAGRG